MTEKVKSYGIKEESRKKIKRWFTLETLGDGGI